jgi:galactokinase
MEFVHDTIARYRQVYAEEPALVVTAPGRVNLIGEHTDYNGGFVLPVAMDRAMFVAAGPRADNLLALHSVDLQSSVTARLPDLAYDHLLGWSNYPKGVASRLLKRGGAVSGANLCIRGNIPIASGLSSSAALEVACAVAFQALNGLSYSPRELVELAREAETDFVGVQCGIMDQCVSMFGRKRHALFLDCRDLAMRHVPFPAGVGIVICDTGIKRELARSAYNRREAECDEALRQIRRTFPSKQSLRDVSVDEFRELRPGLTPIAARRASHVVTENQRVLDCVRAMESGELAAMGALMTASHGSLRDDFEVSSKELNAFVEIACASPGVYGARMTGAGFGGCAVCIVAEDRIDALIERLRSEYPRQAGRSFTIYLTEPQDGASIVYPARSLTPQILAARA